MWVIKSCDDFCLGEELLYLTPGQLRLQHFHGDLLLFGGIYSQVHIGKVSSSQKLHQRIMANILFYPLNHLLCFPLSCADCRR